MKGLAPHLKELLGLLCDNHRRGFALAKGTRLPARIRSEIGALRNLGLVSWDGFRPSEGALAMFAPAEAPETAQEGPGALEAASPPPAAAKALSESISADGGDEPTEATASAWDYPRKATFLALLEETGNPKQAAGRMGLAGTGGAYQAKRDDAVFSAAWDAVLRRIADRDAEAPIAAPAEVRRSLGGVLLAEVEAWLEKTGTAVSTFESGARIGKRFVLKLRAGAGCRPATVARIRAFIAEHPNGIEPKPRRKPGRKPNGGADGGAVEAARRKSVPGAPGDAGEGALPQRDGQPGDQGGDTSVAGMAAVDRREPVRHRGVDAGVERAAPPAPAPASRAEPSEDVLLPEPPIERDGAPYRRRADAQICAEALRHQAEQERIAALRPAMTVQEAKVILQRKGRVVYRASVAGGSPDHWYVSGLGNQVTDAELIAKAEAVAGVMARP